MNERVFIDTNYSFLKNDEARHDAAVRFLAGITGREVFIAGHE